MLFLLVMYCGYTALLQSVAQDARLTFHSVSSRAAAVVPSIKDRLRHLGWRRMFPMWTHTSHTGWNNSNRVSASHLMPSWLSRTAVLTMTMLKNGRDVHIASLGCWLLRASGDINAQLLDCSDCITVPVLATDDE